MENTAVFARLLNPSGGAELETWAEEGMRRAMNNESAAGVFDPLLMASQGEWCPDVEANYPGTIEDFETFRDGNIERQWAEEVTYSQLELQSLVDFIGPNEMTYEMGEHLGEAVNGMEMLMEMEEGDGVATGRGAEGRDCR